MTSCVELRPPRSGVRTLPSASTAATADSTSRAASAMLQMVEHHGGAENRGQRIDDALAGDIGRRAVYRLEHRRKAAQRIEIGAGGEPHAADDDGRDVAQDVAE